ncbi:hypothetical protein [Streptomyces sp. NPDC007205]|uniref:hypothetical protein n=1 Tax=Streptomyces sp. NPDC007205 TaxID=3154316 RepID=UPI0033F2D49E
MAFSSGLLYVEGWAFDARRPVIRSWSAIAGGLAQDVTCRRLTRAYLGLPLKVEAMVTLMLQQNVPLVHGNGILTPTALQWLRNGVPAGALAGVGRRVPGGAEALCD